MAPANALRTGSRKRRWIFRLAAATLLPLLLLGALEAVLHLAGTGFPAAFFLEAKQGNRTVLIENARFGWLFFPRALARAPSTIVMPLEKPAGACRIFVFGESAAKGEPEPAFGFARILEVLLEARLPEKRFEIVNVAVTAFNSHTIVPIARDCARQEGDYWVLYLGNNEVLGPYGAGSIFGARSPNLTLLRASLALKRTRIGQLLDGLLSSVGSGGTVPESWGGMEMFLKQQFRQDDPRLEVVYQHFAANLDDILEYGTASGARVLLSTLAYNLRDCAPFASLHSPSLSEASKAEWDKQYQAGSALEAAGKPAAAIQAFQEAVKVDDSYAEVHFRLGRCFWAEGLYDKALHHYTLARDLDTIRFRADTRTNSIIRETARACAERGKGDVVLVDAERSLANASPHGIGGEEMFHEHVHFNFSGNYLLASLFARQIAALLSAEPPGDSQLSGWLDAKECAQRLAYTPWEQAVVTEKVLQRLRKPPYSSQLNHPERDARLLARLAALRSAQKAAGVEGQAAVYEQALARAPEDWELHDHYGTFLAVSGKDSQAADEFLKVTQLAPHYYAVWYRLGLLFEGGTTSAKSEKYFREALSLRPDFADAIHGLGMALAHQDKQEAACAEFAKALKIKPELLDARMDWALSLSAQGKKSGAMEQYRRVLELRPRHAGAHFGLGNLLKEEGDLDKSAVHLREAERLFRETQGLDPSRQAGSGQREEVRRTEARTDSRAGARKVEGSATP